MRLSVDQRAAGSTGERNRSSIFSLHRHCRSFICSRPLSLVSCDWLNPGGKDQNYYCIAARSVQTQGSVLTWGLSLYGPCKSLC
ncbi:unnamed protein product [Gadus morhua 'NCC']